MVYEMKLSSSDFFYHQYFFLSIKKTWKQWNFQFQWSGIYCLLFSDIFYRKYYYRGLFPRNLLFTLKYITREKLYIEVIIKIMKNYIRLGKVAYHFYMYILYMIIKTRKLHFVFLGNILVHWTIPIKIFCIHLNK